MRMYEKIKIGHLKSPECAEYLLFYIFSVRVLKLLFL